MAYTDAQRGIALKIIHKHGGITQQAIQEAQAALNAPGLSGSTLHGWLKKGDSKPKAKKAESKRPNPESRIEPPTDLTAKQTLFIGFYLATLNGTKAARLAGYDTASDVILASIASENLRKPNIRAEIDRQLAERIMGANEVMARLTEQASGDLGAFIGLTAEQIKIHPQSHLVKKLKQTINTDPEGKIETRVEIELHDPQAALVLIGKYHAIFADRLKVDISIELITQAVEALQAAGADPEDVFKRMIESANARARNSR